MGSQLPPPPASEIHAPPISFAEWEIGLPDADSLPPLSQPLVPPELASAFRISPLSHRSFNDVIRASEEFILTLRRGATKEGSVSDPDGWGSGSDPKRLKRFENFVEEADSGVDNYASNDGDEGEDEGENIGNKSVKRQRLVWTPQLHKRFVDVVAHLGIKNAVPKTIMQMMNVEGLTRENVASHLQKYRLYLKRMNGGLEEGSGLRELGSETNRSQNMGNEGNIGVPMPMMAYGGVTGQGIVPMPLPMPMPVYGMPNGHAKGPGNSYGFGGYGGFDYGMVQGAEWNGYMNGAIGSFNQMAHKEN